MERYFNTEGVCNPKYHYMVRLDDRLHEIKHRFVDRGKYFIINRGRQYGKTTTLHALIKYLSTNYLISSMDFQEIGTAEFQDENTFSRAFAEIFLKSFKNVDLEKNKDWIRPIDEFIKETNNGTLRELFYRLSKLCEKAVKPVIIMIDEVDSATNNQVFLDFLALLRRYYLDRDNNPIRYLLVQYNSLLI